MRYIFLGKKVRLSTLLPSAVYLWAYFCGYETALASLFAVLIHEAGHLTAGIVLRRRISSVTLSALGADIEYTGVSSYKTNLLIAVAGPFASILAGAVTTGGFSVFSSVSVIYGMMNLIPVPCFDGGRALRCILYNCAGVVTADKICDAVSVVFLLVLYLFSVFLLFYTSFNASLLFICFYVFADSYIKMNKNV